MFTCGEIKYLNCGDIEYEVEKKILDKKIDIKADIFKLNHHAGNTSNEGPFQKAVNAKYVYHTNPDCTQGIGNGKDSKYDWVRGPVSKAVARSNVYAPRFNGNTTFTVNKGQITVNPERNYTNVTVKGKNMVTGAIKSFTMKIAKGTKYIMTNLSLPVAYKLN
jgi:beta-lactamase superfamily II metal-dependent hydrolase